MKKIITFTLAIGLLIACTEKDSVEIVQPDVVRNETLIAYHGKLYNLDDEFILTASTAESVILQIDFEDYPRLFDNVDDLQQFANNNFSGKYSKAIANGIKSNSNKQQNSIGAEVGHFSKPRNFYGNAKAQNTIYDFELFMLDGNCTTYPVTSFEINLVAFPNYTLSNPVGLMGYNPRSFAYTIPAGGSMTFNYHGTLSCQHYYVFLATTTGCRNAIFSSLYGCFGSGFIKSITWNVTIG